MFRRLMIILILGLCPMTVLAQSVVGTTGVLHIPALAETDPVAAIEAIDQITNDPSQQDQRTLFDLLVLKARLQAELGQDAAAAQLYLQLGQLAARSRDVLQWDPASLYDRSAELFQRAKDTDSAEVALSQIAQEQRDGGASAEQIAATIDRIAELWRDAGDTALADGIATNAQAVREAVAPTRSVGDAGGYREVEVFYATDRARSGDPKPSEFYGGTRGTLDLGVALVTIPDTHEAGVVEAPSIWRLEFGPNPAKHVVLQSVTPVGEDAFYGSMNATLAALETSDAFVFVHGYNVRFDAAAKRAAQMAYDMNFPGVPILYSWPSRGSATGYIADTAVVRLSGRRLSGFLDNLIDRTEARTIHIVGHSMGNRALTDALELLALRRGIGPGSVPVFDQVLFAAPDLDADLFAEMMPVIRPLAKRLTLYASNEDWALATSKQLHGNAPRAGQGGESMLVNDEIDSIDMSELGSDMMAHSYFADDSSALADMFALFWRNVAPGRRCGLQPVAGQTEADVQKWQYVAAGCEGSALVEVMAHLREAEVSDAETAERIVAETVKSPQMAKTLAPIVSKLFGDK